MRCLPHREQLITLTDELRIWNERSPSRPRASRRDGFLRNSEKLRGELRLWTPELAPHQQSPSAPV